MFHIPATPNKRAIGNALEAYISRRSLHHGHRQGRGHRSDGRKSLPHNRHLGFDILAAEQQQSPARGLRQQRRGADRQTRCLPSHDHRSGSFDHLQGHGQGQEPPGLALRGPKSSAQHKPSLPRALQDPAEGTARSSGRYPGLR